MCHPPLMNIHKYPVRCPACHQRSSRKHGAYVRKGFHAPHGATAPAVRVPRYRCLNPACRRTTFSLLPEGVLPLCRFRWSDLLSVWHALAAGTNACHLARHVWHVGLGVIVRTRALLARMQLWTQARYREITDGMPGGEFETMVKHIIGKIGRLELLRRWYRHRYAGAPRCKSG